MSVLVKGMEMPETCKQCKIISCHLYHWISRRNSDCPLVEVPTPHDSLIDEFVEYVEDNFEVSVAVEETSDCDTFDKIFGALPEKEDE